MHKYWYIAAAVTLGTLPSLAQAEATLEQRLAVTESRLASLEQDNTAEDRVQINGFMTFAMEKSNRIEDASGSDLFYQGTVGQDDWNLNRLTRAGVQVNSKISDDAEAVVQVIGRADSDFDAKIQWAYVAYDINNTLTARAGRLVLPIYMHSQYVQVGYAYPGVELPSEMYSIAPVETMEGMDLTWSVSTGQISHNINVLLGGTRLVKDGVELRPNKMHGINIRSNVGHWTGWYSYTAAEVSADLSGIIEAQTTIPGATALNLDSQNGYFTSAGLQYDNGNLFISAERARLKISSPAHWLPRQDTAYLTAGYRIGKLTPHLTWASLDHSRISEVNTSGLPPLESGLARPFFQGFGDQQKSWTLGTRYDLTAGVSLKAEVSSYYDFTGDTDDYDSNGLFSDPSNPANSNGPDDEDDDVLVYRLAVETVF